MNHDNLKQIYKGAVAILPLSLAVIPWGILAGSYAVEAGLSAIQAQAMSAIVFAGAAQLVAVGMIKAGVGLGSILLSCLFISSRHLLYSVSMRTRISVLPLRWRLLLGFWLTDELFAVCSSQSETAFNGWYAVGAGGGFYLIWNLASFVGIVAGSQLPSLNEMGLDFVVAATFIALVFPLITNRSVLLSVVVSLVLSVILTVYRIDGALVMASLVGMFAGFMSESVFTQKGMRNDMAKETSI